MKGMKSCTPSTPRVSHTPASYYFKCKIGEVVTRRWKAQSLTRPDIQALNVLHVTTWEPRQHLVQAQAIPRPDRYILIDLYKIYT